MASIKKLFNHHPVQEQNDLNTGFKAAQADLDGIRAALVALTAKIDTDFTAQNIAVTSSQLDENYATTVDPAANTLVD